MERQIGNIYIKRFYYFNVYVIKGESGDILIDTGFICMQKKLKKWLDKFNIKLIILTHAHVDHTWNAAYIKKLYNCEIAMSEDDIINLDNRKIVTYPLNKHYELWTKLMKFGMKKFIAEKFDVDILLKDNQELSKYGINLKIILLPGHTMGSIGIIYKNYLFVGDALVNRQNQHRIACHNQNIESAKKSYEKVLSLSPEIIFVGHDKEITKDKLEKVEAKLLN